MTIQFPTRTQTLTKQADELLKADKLNWQTVDVDTLPRDLRQLYDAYKDAARIAAERRTAFEDAICGPLAKMLSARPGQDVAFAYRFGQLSVALTDKHIPKAKANALRFG